MKKFYQFRDEQRKELEQHDFYSLISSDCIALKDKLLFAFCVSLRVSHPPKIVSNDPKPIFTALSATSTHSVAICYSFFL